MGDPPPVGTPALRAPPGIWTFLSSLGESGFFGSLLMEASAISYQRSAKLESKRVEEVEAALRLLLDRLPARLLVRVE